MADRAELLVAGARIPYAITRSRRRRRTLTLAVVDGTVRVAVPWHAPAAEVHAFVQGRAAWIARRLAQEAARPPRFAVTPGARVPLGGEAVSLALSPSQARPPP